MAAHDPTQLPGAARGPVPGNGAGHPLQPQPLRPMPVPIQPVPVGNGVHPQPVAAAPQSPVARAPMPLPRPALHPMAPQPLAPQPVSAVQRPAPQPALRPAPILVPAGTVMPRASDVPEEDEQPALEEVVKKNAPPWLISMSIQMLLVLSLGLWSMPQDKKPQELNVAEYSDQEGDDLGESTVDFESAAPEDDNMAIADLQPVDNPFAAPPLLTNSLGGNTAGSDVAAPVLGMGLQGREVGMKDALLKAYGGDGNSEAAVRRGLEWLSKQQKADGSWSIKGPYSEGAIFAENSPSATAMAMLAFQGAGQTHIKGDFKKVIDKGLKYLLKKMEKDGRFPIEGKKDQTLYTQAQCTIALCEMYAMTQDSLVRESAEKSVQFCLEAQNPDLGGWRYAPGQDSDTSVTGWMMMALQSAKMGGIEVPKSAFDNVKQYLDRASQHGGARYSYQPGGASDDVCMTAEGLLCRQWLGWSRNDNRMRKGAEWLLEEDNLPKMKDQDVYYWYYGTQMMHHLEGAYWKKWNENMKGMLVKAQVTSGKERGSWNPGKDKWGTHAGRLYQTCLSVYILEAYYRHLPLYAGAAR